MLKANYSSIFHWVHYNVNGNFHYMFKYLTVCISLLNIYCQCL